MSTSAEILAADNNWQLLASLQRQYDEQPLPWTTINQALREAGFAPELANALTSQLELREAAQAKFGDSARHMLFTRRHLEQATRFPVALLHAQRFLKAGITTVADLGCGIGTEALAMATSGLSVVAVDLDPEAIACAVINLRPFPEAQVILEDIHDFDPSAHNVTGLFLDPARRDAHGRRFSPQQWSPPWSFIEELCQGSLPLAAKLAPGIDHHLLPPDSFTQWLSVNGALVETSLWTRELRLGQSGFAAAVMDDNGIHTLEGQPEPAPVGPLERFLYEPDPAAIRSGLLNVVADEVGGQLISPSIAYGTAPAVVDSPFVQWFTVLDVVPLRTKILKRTLRGLDAGVVEVKKRGADVNPAELQKSLSGDGSRQLVVFATRVGDQHRAIIGERRT